MKGPIADPPTVAWVTQSTCVTMCHSQLNPRTVTDLARPFLFVARATHLWTTYGGSKIYPTFLLNIYMLAVLVTNMVNRKPNHPIYSCGGQPLLVLYVTPTTVG